MSSYIYIYIYIHTYIYIYIHKHTKTPPKTIYPWLDVPTLTAPGLGARTLLDVGAFRSAKLEQGGRKTSRLFGIFIQPKMMFNGENMPKLVNFLCLRLSEDEDSPLQMCNFMGEK